MDWTVGHDSAQTVTLHHLDGDDYVVRATMPLVRLLGVDPGEHGLS